MKQTGKKKKFETVLDLEIIKKLKELSISEGRAINDIIYDALIGYSAQDATNLEIRRAALERFYSEPFSITPNELKKLLDGDFYAQ